MSRKSLHRLVAVLSALLLATLFVSAFIVTNQVGAQGQAPGDVTAAKARVRVAHLAPFDSVLANTAVDVKLGGTQVLTAFGYLSSTTYIEVDEGEYLVEVFPSGTMTPAITATVVLSKNEDYTAIAHGGANGYGLTLAALLDDNSKPPNGFGKVRFGHLAPFAPILADTEAEIRTDSGALVAGPIFYGDIASTYLELAAGEYDLEVTTPGGADVLIDLAPFTLNNGDILYALAVGDGSNQDVGVFAYPTDLEGFLLPTEQEAKLRVAHLAPFDSVLANTGVDVKLDGTQVLTDFQYLDSTTYIDVLEGTYLVEVFPTGTVTPAITATVNLAVNEDYSAIAHGGANGYGLTLAALLDDNSAPASGNGKVRFGHLAPFAPVLADTEAEIRTDSGALVAGPLFYGDIESTYLELAAGEYDLEVTTPGGADVLIDLAPFDLNDGDILYALAVGDGSNQDVGVFAYPTDLEGFLLPTEQEARLRVAHLAPFDSVLANTAVDVKLDGTEVLTNFQYLESTTYIEVPDGEYLVEVFPSGTVTPAITATVNLAVNEDYSAIAHGGANGYDLTLAALLDDNSAPASGNGKVRFGHLAPFAPVPADTEAEIRIDGGAVVAGPFLYGDIESTYLELAAGEYDLEVTTPGGADVLIDLAPFDLNDGDILYALAVGDGSNQDTNVFAYPTDLEGFLLPKETEFASVRVAHLAPFDSVLANTGVDVKLNGTQVLTDFQYLDSTTYIDVLEGTYLVEVFPTGTSTAVVSGTVKLTGNMDYSAIAHGGANGYDLTLAALLDDNSAPASGNGKVRFGHLAPFAPVLADTEAEIRTDSGALVAGPFLYGEIDSTYLELAAGNYDLKVTAAGGGATLINLAPFTLNDGDILYALAVGDGSNQDTGVFAYPTDLEGFLLPLEALYQIFMPLILN